MQVARQMAWDAPLRRPALPPAAPPAQGAGRVPRTLPRAPQARVHWTGLAVCIAMWVVLVGLCLFYVYRYAQVIRAGSGLAAIRGQIQALAEQNQKLEAEVAYLSSLARLESEATKLGMVKPQEFRVATVDRSAVARASGQQAVAAPAPPPGLWSRVVGYVAGFRISASRAEAAGGRPGR